MALRISGEPAIEPITLAEAKAHCRILFDDEDTLISALIKAARREFELQTRRALITQSWKLTLDDFPETFYLERPPVQSVTAAAFKYYDVDGVLQTMSSANYQVDIQSEPARVVAAIDYEWPSVQTDKINAVELVFKSGYGDAAASVPQLIKQALLLIVGHWYENREATIAGSLAEIPLGAQAIINQYRIIY